MSHTPGPWDVDDDTMEIFSITPGHSTGWIAKVLGNDDNGRPLTAEEMESNARLIAAAPEMLKELKFLVEQFEEAVDWVPEYTAMADRAKAAIAKAEGRE